jgi:dihydroxyacetone kinase-like predicted kinase
MGEAGSVIFLVFLIGGAFTVVDETGVLRRAIPSLVRVLEGRDILVVPVVSLLFATGGVVENMQEQYQEFIRDQARPPLVAEELGDTAIVVVAPGAGLTRVFESLGVSAVVPGGQTMNPSTQQILKAIEGLKAEKIIVLPNNSNVIMAAQQAATLSGKEVRVVPTETVPQGIAALLAINYQADLETNAQAMQQAMEQVQTAEITRATRSVRINGLEVEEGAVIGLLNGDLTATGPDIESVVRTMLKQMRAEDAEIITVYYGADVTRQQAEAMSDLIRQEYPDQEVELVEGGQPHYQYIISAE